MVHGTRVLIPEVGDSAIAERPEIGGNRRADRAERLELAQRPQFDAGGIAGDLVRPPLL